MQSRSLCAQALRNVFVNAQALGKRLGPAMKAVCAEVKAMSSSAVLAMQVRTRVLGDGCSLAAGSLSAQARAGACFVCRTLCLREQLQANDTRPDAVLMCH